MAKRQKYITIPVQFPADITIGDLFRMDYTLLLTDSAGKTTEYGIRAALPMHNRTRQARARKNKESK